MTVPRITGNTAVDVVAVICSVLVLAFFAWMAVTGMRLFVEWRRLLKSTRPSAPVMPELARSVPVVEPRSPFRRKRVAG